MGPYLLAANSPYAYASGGLVGLISSSSRLENKNTSTQKAVTQHRRRLESPSSSQLTISVRVLFLSLFQLCPSFGLLRKFQLASIPSLRIGFDIEFQDPRVGDTVRTMTVDIPIPQIPEDVSNYEISVANLTYSHNRSAITDVEPALLDISFTLPKGSRTLLVGANGGQSLILSQSYYQY